MDDELSKRIRRIYAAIGATEENDPTNLRATVISTEEIKGVFQDFRCGLSDEQLENAAFSMIHNIASLRDHLKRWAAQSGRDKKRVDAALGSSFELQVILDLSNNDKHGYAPRNCGKSGRSPKLVEINRVMQLTTKGQTGSAIAMTLSGDGTPVISGDGSAMAVITGDVVDKGENRIGELHAIANKAVVAWEELLSEFNVAADTNAL